MLRFRVEVSKANRVVFLRGKRRQTTSETQAFVSHGQLNRSDHRVDIICHVDNGKPELVLQQTLDSLCMGQLCLKTRDCLFNSRNADRFTSIPESIWRHL